MNDSTKLKKFEATMVEPVALTAPDRTRLDLWKHLLTGFLKQSIKVGTLHLTFPDASRLHFGSGKPYVAATIASSRSLRRIALNPDIATGEADMDGSLRIDSGDI